MKKICFKNVRQKCVEMKTAEFVECNQNCTEGFECIADCKTQYEEAIFDDCPCGHTCRGITNTVLEETKIKITINLHAVTSDSLAAKLATNRSLSTLVP